MIFRVEIAPVDCACCVCEAELERLYLSDLRNFF